MCRNSYQNKRQGIGNISVTKLHRFKGHKSIKSSGIKHQIDRATCRSDFEDEVRNLAMDSFHYDVTKS